MNTIGAPPDVQASITLLFFLLLFGWWGIHRGFIRELVVFVGLIFLRVDQGHILISLFNWFRFTLQLAALLFRNRHKGASAVFGNASNVYKATVASGSANNAETTTVLLGLLLATIVLIYVVSGLFKRKLPGFGALLGALNGYLLGSWLLPALPHALPTPQVISGGVSDAANNQAGQLLAQGLSKTQSILGLDPFYLIVVVCVAVVIWAMREIG